MRLAMAVMTHAPILPSTVHLHHLRTNTADAANRLLDLAEMLADEHNLTASAIVHAQAATLLGIRPPASGELARCNCQGCYCTCVFDAARARTYIDGSVEFVQCEDCADDHPRDSE